MARTEAQKAAERRYEAKNKAKRQARKDYWLFEFYPESAPENWKEIISSWLIDCLVSPLHEFDVNENGTRKKPHYHAILFFDSLKTFEQVHEIIEPLNGPIPIAPRGTKRNCTRYLCHLNNPEKFQYDESEVLEFQNADYETLKQRDADKYGYISEMMDFVDGQGCYSFAALMRYARDNRTEWFRALCDNSAYVMKEYCKTAAYDHLKGYYPELLDVKQEEADIQKDEEEKQESEQE